MFESTSLDTVEKVVKQYPGVAAGALIKRNNLILELKELVKQAKDSNTFNGISKCEFFISVDILLETTTL